MSSHGALAKKRQADILETIRQEGSARVADLVREHRVSDMTIRRDLDVLAQRGLLEKVHGGATAIGMGTTDEPTFAVKGWLNRAEKEAIAARAEELVVPGTAIGLSAGTTVHALANRIVDVPGLTIVTNSVPVAEFLFRNGRQDQTIISSGGIRTPSDALVGPVALQGVRMLNLNQLFLGVHGMSASAGFTTPNLMEAEVNQAMLQNSAKVVVLADHTKWEVVGLATIAPLKAADTLITDNRLTDAARERLGADIGEVITASVTCAEDSDGASRMDKQRA